MNTKQISVFEDIYEELARVLTERSLYHQYFNNMGGFITIEILIQDELTILHEIRSITSLKAIELKTELNELKESLKSNQSHIIYVSENIPYEFRQQSDKVYKTPYIKYDHYHDVNKELTKSKMAIELGVDLMFIFMAILQIVEESTDDESVDHLSTQSMIKEFFDLSKIDNPQIDENIQHAYLFINRDKNTRQSEMNIYNRDIPSIILVDILKSHMDHVSMEIVQEYLAYRGTESKEYTPDELIEYGNFIRNNF